MFLLQGVGENDDPELYSGTLTDSTARLTSAIRSDIIENERKTYKRLRDVVTIKMMIGLGVCQI